MNIVQKIDQNHCFNEHSNFADLKTFTTKTPINKMVTQSRPLYDLKNMTLRSIGFETV